MKIAFFTDDYLPYVHGVITSMRNYRQALEALGHEVYIVAPSPKMKGYEDDDDHIIRLPSVNSYVFDNRPVSLVYPGIARKLDAYEFDIIHSQTQFYVGVIAALVAKRQCIPHVTTVHTLFSELLDDYPIAVTAGLIAVTIGFPFVYKIPPVLPLSKKEIMNLTDYDMREIKKKQGWKLIATAVNQTDTGIAPSRHLAATLKRSGTKVPVEVLPNGIPLGKYRQSHASDSPLKKRPGQKFIVCVARVSGEKRQATLIDAMRYVQNPDATLVLVGVGPLKEELEEKVRLYGLEDRVIFAGMQSPEAVAAILKQADIFTLASYHFDNQPMVILEAIASGLPVVYCDPRLKEGLTKDNALLTKGRGGRAFAHAFDELLVRPETCKAMGIASQEIAKTFDNMHLAKKLVAIYEKCLDSHAARN